MEDGGSLINASTLEAPSSKQGALLNQFNNGSNQVIQKKPLDHQIYEEMNILGSALQGAPNSMQQMNSVFAGDNQQLFSDTNPNLAYLSQLTGLDHKNTHN